LARIAGYIPRFLICPRSLVDLSILTELDAAFVDVTNGTALLL